ncbi:hypothetical protein RHGRI_038891 [Rhododendron griersonianum]|uniref:Uncharacterized protein n=2 Tax=Rhododendron griersonianum TaxID=479676 RepID=A0AAV6HI05_9ERIC|nr:hypothetical protein RHGRI_038891 [Rhododendron griersonianum]
MSSLRQRGHPPFTPRVLADYRSLLAPEYPRLTTPPEDDMELYEVPITWEIPPPAKNPECLSPTKVPTPPMEDFEQPFNFPIFGIETDPELEAALLDLSQYSLEPIMEPPVLTEEERYNLECEILEEAETRAGRDYEIWLREIYGIVLP